MLKFIDQNDFLEVDTFRYNDDGSVAWVKVDGDVTHSGVIREGFTRTISVVTGTEQVEVGMTEPVLDEDGEEITPPETIYEEQSVYGDQVIDVWQNLQDLATAGTITINPIPQSEIDAKNLEAFKANRQALIDNAIVTANGFQFDADEVSISRMANAIIALSGQEDTFILQWSLADTATGVMTSVSLGDLKAAHQLAVQNMANIWGS